MFVETKEAGEVIATPAKVLKLSEAIRKGLEIVVIENKFSFTTCAMGCAFAGIKGRAMTNEEAFKFIGGDISSDPVAMRIAQYLGIPPKVGSMVNGMHLHQALSAADIATQLEARGL